MGVWQRLSNTLAVGKPIVRPFFLAVDHPTGDKKTAKHSVSQAKIPLGQCFAYGSRAYPAVFHAITLGADQLKIELLCGLFESGKIALTAFTKTKIIANHQKFHPQFVDQQMLYKLVRRLCSKLSIETYAQQAVYPPAL